MNNLGRPYVLLSSFLWLAGCGSSSSAEPGTPDGSAVDATTGVDSSSDSNAIPDAGPADAAGDGQADDAAWTPLDAMPPQEGDASVVPSTLQFHVDGVATWLGNAKAAYSIIHDDLCNPSVGGIYTHADPLLTARGLHAGFGAIVGLCDGQWDKIHTLLAHGHEVFNHSWDHPCMTTDPSLYTGNCGLPLPDGGLKPIDLDTQLNHSTTVLQTTLNLPIKYMIFPYDVCDKTAIARLKQLGYLGARCGNLDINLADFPDAFAENFDVWGPAYDEKYFATGPCSMLADGGTPTEWGSAPSEFTAACRTYTLQKYVSDTIAAGGYAIHEFHGFEGDPDVWEPLNPDEYAADLDWVKANVDSGNLWVEGPTTVTRYRFARTSCGLPTASGSTLTFSTASADCQKYATTLSYLVSVVGYEGGADDAGSGDGGANDGGAGGPPLNVQQWGHVVAAKSLGGGKYVVNADPTQGAVVLGQ